MMQQQGTAGDPQPFGERLRLLRERAGLSRDKLARAIGMKGGSSLQRYEDPSEFNTKPIPGSVISKISLALVGLGTPPIEPKEVLELGENMSDLLSVMASARKEVSHSNPEGAASEISNVHPLLADADELVGLKDIPVYGSAQGGPDGEIIIDAQPVEWVKRPEPLSKVPKGFAVFVTGDSMSPRYEQGDILLVHPNRPPSPGRDVLLTRMDDGRVTHALVKRLLRATENDWHVREYCPEVREFTLPRATWNQAFLIVGTYHAR